MRLMLSANKVRFQSRMNSVIHVVCVFGIPTPKRHLMPERKKKKKHPSPTSVGMQHIQKQKKGEYVDQILFTVENKNI
jgi:hypothetical protein